MVDVDRPDARPAALGAARQHAVEADVEPLPGAGRPVVLGDQAAGEVVFVGETIAAALAGKRGLLGLKK